MTQKKLINNEKQEYKVIDLAIDEAQANSIKSLAKGQHLHFQINKNQEVIIHKK